ncbi:molybdopterin-synthase adenylyltransferase MoeB [Thermorudis peleae]|uniref:molybdopterin-synthase adenylyltransferase MoeB n=1 Tax=Thermorudis peleae TaxID=1382356 RepID=UPI00056FC352|nr:molybdopterin-synthase adenylyltransferase MoeB [Thermorudis peleae]
MPREYEKLFQEIKQAIQEVDVHQLYQELRQGRRPVVIDVREREEWEQGYIPGAVFIPRGYLELQVEDRVPDKDTPVYVYCAGGVRSAFAAKTLQEMGYRHVYSVAGGFSAWKHAGYPFVTPRQWTREQLQRYSRHFLIPEVGESGQARLLDSKVLVIGAGGLGSPAALYLAAAGVGTIGIVDNDVVDLSNLQRQIIHTTDRVGQPKTESARQTLTALNPDVNVVLHDVWLTSQNILDIIRDYDVIVNGADNFPTRYLVNDAAVLLGKPVVDASIFRFEGMVTVYKPGEGPCYRCLFPEPPPADLAPTCDQAGVLGVLTGVIGALQANEAIKLLLGLGEPLVGRVLLFDGLTTTFRELTVARDPDCAICGPNATVTPETIGQIDYQQSCLLPSVAD